MGCEDHGAWAFRRKHADDELVSRPALSHGLAVHRYVEKRRTAERGQAVTGYGMFKGQRIERPIVHARV